MRKMFVASLCRNGILGGGLYVDAESVTYRTGKLTVPETYRKLKMAFEEITAVSTGWLLCFPTVTIKLRDQEEYKFIVFARKQFLYTISQAGVKI